jgi:hypothetical protein
VRAAAVLRHLLTSDTALGFTQASFVLLALAGVVAAAGVLLALRRGRLAMRLAGSAMLLAALGLAGGTLLARARIAAAVGPPRLAVLLAMRARPDDPWPRGSGHIPFGPAGAAERQKAYLEPGGSFSPQAGSFGVAFWVVGGDGRLITTSDAIPLAATAARYVRAPDGIAVHTAFYDAVWTATGVRRFHLSLAGHVPEGAHLEVTIRGVGPAGGALTAIRRDGAGLVLGDDWRVGPVAPDALRFLGVEGSAGWLRPVAPAAERVADPAGWAAARFAVGSTAELDVTAAPAATAQGAAPAATAQGAAPAVTAQGAAPAVTAQGAAPAVTAQGAAPAVMAPAATAPAATAPAATAPAEPPGRLVPPVTAERVTAGAPAQAAALAAPAQSGLPAALVPGASPAVLAQAAPVVPAPAEPPDRLVLDGIDPQFAQALRAQVMTLQQSLVGTETRPGDPLNYPLQWLRDGAYVVVALARAGELAQAAALTAPLLAADFFGGFGAEADAPGLALWALAETAALAGGPAADPAPAVSASFGPVSRPGALAVQGTAEGPAQGTVEGRTVEGGTVEGRTAAGQSGDGMAPGAAEGPAEGAAVLPAPAAVLWPAVQRKAALIGQMLQARTELRHDFTGPVVPAYAGRPDLTLVAEPAQDGLIIGRMDWGRPVFFVNAASYAGLRGAASLARRLGHAAEAQAWSDEAAALGARWRAAFAAPGFAGQRANERTAIVGLWPSGIADPAAYGAWLAELWPQRWDDAAGGFRTRPLWTYFDVAEAHQWLELDRPDRAWDVLGWFWRHQPAPGLYTLWEGAGEENGFGLWQQTRGWVRPPDVTPHYWAAAEVLLLQLAMLAEVRETPGGRVLMIGAGVPAAWLARPIRVAGIGTAAGFVDWAWDGRRVAVHVADAALPVRLGAGFPPGTPVGVR